MISAISTHQLWAEVSEIIGAIAIAVQFLEISLKSPDSILLQLPSTMIRLRRTP